MNDPHVEKLIYRLELTDAGSFVNPPPISGETDVFRLRLENETVTFEFKEHFASVSAARTVVENFQRAWELDDALRRGHPTIRFRYQESELIDRNPPPPGSPLEINLRGEVNAVGTVSARLTVSRSEYPAPPKDFGVSPDVETMWHRYVGYLEQHEPLQSMAYFCSTVIEKDFDKGKRAKAARKYNIDEAVLKKLGHLSSNKGDNKTARKATAIANPLSNKEEEWIKAAVLVIIRRVGELNTSSSLRHIEMGVLPEL